MGQEATGGGLVCGRAEVKATEERRVVRTVVYCILAGCELVQNKGAGKSLCKCV